MPSTEINHNPQVQPGPAGVKAFFRHYLDAFPDTKVALEDVIEEGDPVKRALIGAHADPASSGTCCRWHPQKRR